MKKNILIVGLLVVGIVLVLGFWLVGESDVVSDEVYEG